MSKEKSLVAPKVSVLMSVYKETEELITKAVDSILNQTYKNLELIIVLDNPDNREARLLLERYKKNDDRVNLIVNAVNVGLAKSLNRALKYSTGDLIARMDSDDYSYPRRIEIQVGWLLEKKLDLIGGFFRTIDEEGKELFCYRNLPVEEKKVKKKIWNTNCVPHPVWLGRKEMFIKLSGYNDIPYSEDYDFLLRATKQSFRLGNVGELIFDYRITKNSISRNHLLEQYLVSRYLVSCYKKRKKVSVGEIDILLKRCCTDYEKQRYASANGFFNESLSYLRAGKLFQTVRFSTKAFFSSKYFARKMIGMVLAVL